MATGTIAPSPVFTGLDSSGNPLSGGKLYTYVAGTTTAQTTFSDVGLTVANANPVVLDSAGRASVFLTPGASYKFVLKTSADATVWTADNILAVPTSTASLEVTGTAGETLAANDIVYLADGTGGTTAGRWYKATASTTAASTLAKMLGAASAAIVSGQTGSIKIGGDVTGLSGLTAGSLYYVSATAGQITTAAPANARVFGVADTTTSLTIDRNSTAGPVTVGGALTVGGTLGVTGATTLSGVVTIPAGSQTVPALTTTGDSNTGVYFPAADTVSLTTGGTDRLKVDSVGLLTLSAGQIKFPATQNASSDANTLDDYEEGAWTPTISGSTSTTGQTYSFQLGRYVKIGTMVLCTFDVQLSNKGTITGSAIIGGLPFSARSQTGIEVGSYSAAYFAGFATSFTWIAGHIGGAVTNVTLYGLTAAGTGTSPVDVTAIGNTTRLAGSIMYEASA